MNAMLPQIPEGATSINDIVGVVREDAFWTYYVYLWPMYSHPEGSQNHFRLIAAMLVQSGMCRQRDIVKTFGVNRKMLNRAGRQLSERGMESFFEKRRGRKGGTVLTPEKRTKAQELFNLGYSRSEVADELAISTDVLRKALSDGRLSTPETIPVPVASTMSERTQGDAHAADAMGTACVRVLERCEASLGMGAGAPVCFEPCLDVPMGGVLCALPALLENGLLSNGERLGKVDGYYTAVEVLLVLAFMMLCRIATVEQLRKYAPGELGKLIGLDRVPEARCMRKKMDELAGETEAENWAAQLASQWLEQQGESSGFLYVDGHVKVYGGRVKLPRRFVSRQRLCLRGISFYWVNDAIGQPFFVVEKQIDRGMLEALRSDIIPRLLQDIPNQPSEKELKENPLLHRFIIVFDREGYSPAFFKEVWEEHRIACMTYQKNCTDNWSEAEFEIVETTTPSGEPLFMKLAERGTFIGKERVLVKEIRKLTERGHQTSIVSTAKTLSSSLLAPHMFARWSQENFFAYAMHHFAIDELTSFGEEAFSGTEIVVNPEWRALDREQRSLRGKLTRTRAKYQQIDTQKRADPGHIQHANWLQSKADLLGEIEYLQTQQQKTKEQKKGVEKHVYWKDLPEKERFAKLPPSRRILMNTIGMIAYRAETAMALLLKCENLNLSQARALIQGLFKASVDLIPDGETLNIHLHGAARPIDNRHLAELLKQLNETETHFPGTGQRMVFHSRAARKEKGEDGSPKLPGDQEF